MEQPLLLSTLSIEQDTKSHLDDIAKWSRFLSIGGMILFALVFFFSIYAMSQVSESSSRFLNSDQEDQIVSNMKTTLFIRMLVIVAVAFVPLIFLLRFSSQLKNALEVNDQEQLDAAFRNLKRYFRYVGIMMIICIGLFALGFIAGAILSV